MFKFLKGLIKREEGSEFVEKLIVIAAVIVLGGTVALFIKGKIEEAQSAVESIPVLP